MPVAFARKARLRAIAFLEVQLDTLRKEHPKFNNQAARALEKLHKEGAKIVEGMKTEVERDVHSQV